MAARAPGRRRQHCRAAGAEIPEPARPAGARITGLARPRSRRAAEGACHARRPIFSPETPRSRADCPTHDVFFSAGITVIEYLTNLDRIGVARCRFITLPLAIEGADGSPVRAIALLD